MSELHIKTREQAEAIIKAWGECRTCSECKLNSHEGWRCRYIKEQAEKYLKKHKE